MESQIIPNGNILSAKELGRAIRVRRRASGLTQADTAALCGVGARFLGELERGKETVQLDKVFRILRGLGLELHITTKKVPR